MITLVPVGGLCNRMRAMDAALALHRVTGVPLRVYWESNALLNCPFHRLFLPIPGIELVEGISWSSRLLLRFGRFHAAARVLGRLTGTTYYHHDENERLELDVATEQLHKLRQLHIISFARFHQAPEQYSSFRPIPELEQRIAEITDRFDQWTIGVHIRRTDNAHSIAVSSTGLFKEAMEQLIREKPRTRFYLATDCQDTKQELISQFGDRIITGEEPVDRASISGMQHALVELFALSRTGYLFRSHFSSFSRTAAEIGHIPSHVIGRPD